MKPKLVPLLPATDGNASRSDGSSTGSSGPSSWRIARRRQAVSVACDACRRKKIRCDGQRPTCVACREHVAQCTYRDIVKLTIHDDPAIADVVRLLKLLPDQVTEQLLQDLEGQVGLSRLLSMRRGSGQLPQQPSALSLAAATSESTFAALELRIQNPIAYPYLAPISSLFADQDSLRRLTQPGGGLSDLPRHTMPAQQSMMLPGATPELPRASSADSTPSSSTGYGPEYISKLCDKRLDHLEIGYWTSVPIGNDLASRVISLYLETDHPLLGLFEPSLFIRDLVGHRSDFCSQVLVNALLYWACQMYATIDPQSQGLATPFRTEAERLWRTEREEDTILNMATALLLSFSYIGQGRDHAVLKYLAEASSMGVRMGLFGVESSAAQLDLEALTPDAHRAYSYTAWGVFNWIIFISLFYHQPGLVCPKYPPNLPILGDETSKPPEGATARDEHVDMSASIPHYMGRTFPHICSFWRIMHEVVITYYGTDTRPLGLHVSASFAEFKFRELLAWSNNLPSALKQDVDNPHHVLILHIWFHAAVLDIFRPFVSGPLQKSSRLRTFASLDSSASAIFDASLNQLKRLIITYRTGYKSSAYTILWQTALMYVANSVLRSADETESELFYFLLCLYGYEGLRSSWRMSEAIVAGLLSMKVLHGGMSSADARRILEDVRKRSASTGTANIRATFMVDLDLSLSEPTLATAEALASTFEDNMRIKDLTTVFDVSEGI